MDDLKSFFQAVCEGDAATAEAQLIASPELIHAKDDGATPLHLAAINNQRAVVDLLLDHGADINAKYDRHNATPTGWANEKGHVEMVRHLAARGARIDLPRAAAFGLFERVLELLDADPSAINMSGVFGTPLHEASVWGHPRIVALLLARGGDPNLKNCNGKTALAIATGQVAAGGGSTSIAIESRKKEIIAGCAEVIEILKQHGARVD
jgi:ankyrin repeat protein